MSTIDLETVKTAKGKVLEFRAPIHRGKGVAGFSAPLICALAQLSRQDLWFAENGLRANLRMDPLPAPAYIVFKPTN